MGRCPLLSALSEVSRRRVSLVTRGRRDFEVLSSQKRQVSLTRHSSKRWLHPYNSSTPTLVIDVSQELQEECSECLSCTLELESALSTLTPLQCLTVFSLQPGQADTRRGEGGRATINRPPARGRCRYLIPWFIQGAMRGSSVSGGLLCLRVSVSPAQHPFACGW